MLELVKLRAKNFLSYKDLDLHFEDQGLTLIMGENTAGKSAIPSAITWGLFGRTIKGLVGSDVVNWNIDKDCYVEVSFKQDAKNISICRWRKDSVRGDDIEVQINDNVIKGRQREMQEVVNEALQTNFKTFINSVLFSQGLVRSLVEETDRGQREIFKRFLNLGEFDKASSLAANKAQEITDSLEEMTRDISTIKDKKEVLSEQHKRNKEWYNEHEKTKTGRLAILNEELKSLEEPIVPQLGEYDADVAKLSESVAALSNDKVGTQLDLNECEVQIRQWSRDHQDLKVLKGRCPICKQVIDRGTLERHITELQDRVRERSERCTVLRDRIREIDTELQQHLEKQARIREVERSNTEALEQHERARRVYGAEKAGLEARIQELSQPENPYKKTLKDIKVALSELPDISEIENQVQDKYEAALYMEFIRDLFKPKGIQSYVIEHSFDELNTKANMYLRDLSNGELSMEFVPQRQLKTGDIKEEITIKFLKHRREIKYGHLTDAEKANTNIAVIFALHAFAVYQGVSSFNFMFLDEILDLSLDTIRSEALTELLANLVKDTPNIFVISHRQEIMQAFNNIWEVKIDAKGWSSIQNS